MRKLSSIVFLACLAAGGAYGTLVGPNCSTCQGGIYDLTYAPVSIGAFYDMFSVQLSINTASYVGSGVVISEVAQKISNSVASFTLTSAPGGIGMWNSQFGGIGANGCSGSGSGFICSASSLGAAPLSNSPNTWRWDVTIPHNSLAEIPSLSARFEDINGQMAGALVFEEMPGVPEPLTMALTGGGLVLLWLLRKRRCDI